nr:HNH endonuclease signature motif containing protein [uncultured Cellulosilyticum sp.]
MDYKECYGCRKMMPKSNKGCYCPECRGSITESKKQYSVKAETEKVYKSDQWRRTKEEALKRSHYMCEVCEHMGIVKRADAVHHIIKVADGNNSTHFDLNNLVCVCDKHHRKIEGLNKNELIGYLSDLLG